MTKLLRAQPALTTNLVSAAVGIALAVGVDPALGAAVGSLLTVLAGLWTHATVYAPDTVAALVAAAAETGEA